MIATLLFSILILSVSVGENVTISVNERSILKAEDPCMYFRETMSSVAEVEPGVYTLQIGLNCSEGIKVVSANGNRIAAVSISPAKSEVIQKYAFYLERELRGAGVKYSKLFEELNKTLKKVKDLEEENLKLKTDKTALETELRSVKESYELLQSRYNTLTQNLESERGKISQMEIELKSLSAQTATYRTTTLFLISIFIGSFTATVMMLRRR
ncbi:MAG: hypothetical protein NZ872_02705 [Archaeoglobaceae archaeon]|nr:hypothetical protein [Archaeoglobaceae archaeon]MDW8128108.1 hypothetical protein [Archaeoglobaceae archaeon]